jgi:RimJ/RimL family protein N-acetyltransferase
MPGTVFLEGEDVTLNTVHPADHEFVERTHNDPANRCQAGVPNPWGPSTVSDVVADEDSEVLLVCEDGDPVGVVFLQDLDRHARRAELGYFVHPNEHGQGYATRGAALLVDHAFADYDLARVYAEVIAGNDASMRVLEKLGFEPEGVLRSHSFVQGERVDKHLFGLLAGEWEGV